MSMADTSVLSVATNIFASPNEAFAVIRERSRAWLPLLVLIVGYCAVSLLYMNSVDLPWFMDRQLQAGPNFAELTEAQRDEAVQAAANVSPMVYGAIGAVSSTLFVLLWFSVMALYYTGVSFATNDGIKFKQWFSLLAWCALPVLLGLLASLVNLLVTDARFLPQESLNPLSFGSLFSIEAEGASILQRVSLGLDVTTLWSLVLTVLGYQYWTKRSLPVAAVVVLGPLLLIVAISVLVALT
jgi:hypothetical protein